ncbi:hypothetical protein AJ88_19500 [Mesorhizobium amorphae CCBAU 01583]|nr:hypothetical protein AJ88_19500 [Mesorhizobium amorphae CCBAU 01583]
MQRLPLAVALGNVVPVRSGTQNPKHAVHKLAIILATAAGITSLARQQAFDTLPLLAAQFISPGHPSLSRSNLEAYESCLNANLNPECRLDLVDGQPPLVDGQPPPVDGAAALTIAIRRAACGRN